MMSDSGESVESDVDGHFVEQVSQRSSESGESDVDGDWGWGWDWPSENDSASPTLSPPVSGISNDNEQLSMSGSEGIGDCEGKVFMVDEELEIDCLVPLTQTWSWRDEVAGDVEALMLDDLEAQFN